MVSNFGSGASRFGWPKNRSFGLLFANFEVGGEGKWGRKDAFFSARTWVCCFSKTALRFSSETRWKKQGLDPELVPNQTQATRWGTLRGLSWVGAR